MEVNMRQDLRDRTGRRIGYIEDRGNRKEIFDATGRRLGYYDGKHTFDATGRRIGEGDLLATLLSKF